MNRSIHKIIDEQVKRWERQKKQGVSPGDACNVITISRERGSRGQEVAEALAKALGFDLFHHEILEGMVKETRDSSDRAKTLVETDGAKTLLDTLDEKKMNIVEDLVAALVHRHHLWPDEYSKILLRVLNTIGSHGNAVILGRGGNFALKDINALRVRLVAPDDMRRKVVQQAEGLNAEDAQKMMVSTDANRTAYIRRYFNADSQDPANYDLVLNTGTLSVEKVISIIQAALA
ncbi:AAA family ATPase [Desulfobacter curvatus]|uniref:cytidylate kinase-like family protein n=1 Tax=Desulfobacter curvatus TaxID=2290 RepID=UPI00037C0A6F|nr:cytidylate kinase-like family protein [Desulfobacter curvatus]